MSLERLTAEYQSVGIGPKILKEVENVVKAVALKYPPQIYAGCSRWEDGLEDLTQRFVLEVLIEGGQLDYVVLNATDEVHFRRLLARQLRRLLARSRQRTVIDNLLDRCKTIASAPPFTLRMDRNVWSYQLDGKELRDGTAPEGELYEAAARVAIVPTLRASGTERAPVVYSDETLGLILREVAEILDYWISNSCLDRILGLALTPWRPSFLMQSEKDEAVPSKSLTPEEETTVNETAQVVVNACNRAQRHVLRLKLTGIADSLIAKELGLSRPTVAKRKAEVLGILEENLGGVSETLQSEIMRQVGLRLMKHDVEGGDG